MLCGADLVPVDLDVFGARIVEACACFALITVRLCLECATNLTINELNATIQTNPGRTRDYILHPPQLPSTSYPCIPSCRVAKPSEFAQTPKAASAKADFFQSAGTRLDYIAIVVWGFVSAWEASEATFSSTGNVALGMVLGWPEIEFLSMETEVCWKAECVPMGDLKKGLELRHLHIPLGTETEVSCGMGEMVRS